MLTNEHWSRIEDLFHQALDLQPTEREAFLERLSLQESTIKSEVESLLRSHDNADTFLEKSVPQILNQEISSQQTLFKEGNEVGDFRIASELGKGSFGRVYLARQISLNRVVALKVSPNHGEEARTMANLEHDHIVKVFLENVDSQRNLRFICMQYIAGTNLEKVLLQLKEKPSFLGEHFLQTIDDSVIDHASFNPLEFKDRQLLTSFDLVEVTLWMGMKLAHALAYAHGRGILHLDVKPANILLTPYGRPMLTDFNVAVSRQSLQHHTPTVLGGTYRYMAPEHKRIFSPLSEPELKKVVQQIDHRADIFSLGTVIQEMLDIVGPQARRAKEEDFSASEIAIQVTLERSLNPDPSKRFPDAEAQANALESCLELRSIAKAMPPAGQITKLGLRYPLIAMFIFAVWPQVLGSLVNIFYNSFQVVSHLTLLQQEVFKKLVYVYNGTAFPICVWLAIRKFVPVTTYMKDPVLLFNSSPEQIQKLRKQMLDFPLTIVFATIIGWLPATLYFPTLIDYFAGPVQSAVYYHFVISISLSWLVALTYTFLYTQFIGLRVFYPRLWIGCTNIRKTAAKELADRYPGYRIVHFFAGLVPLIGAILCILVGPDRYDPTRYNSFRILLCLLILLGIAGVVMAMQAGHILSQALFALTGEEGAHKKKQPL